MRQRETTAAGNGKAPATGMRRLARSKAARGLHLACLAALFLTFGQPSCPDKPDGVRRATESVSKTAKAGALLAGIRIAGRA